MEKVTITLSPENGSFQGKKVVILSQPVSLGRLMENQEPQTATFLRFNSKVVSRNHAKLWFENNKFYVQDTKSSSGTFLNGERLSHQGMESRPFELHDGDLIKLGEDYSQNGAVHLCVFMRLKLPPGYEAEAAPAPVEAEDGYVDVANENDVKAIVDDEFNTIWNNLTADLSNPLKKLKEKVQQKKEAQARSRGQSDHHEHSRPNSQMLFPGSSLSTTSTLGRADTTAITLIKTTPLSTSSTLADVTSPSNTIEKMMQDPNSVVNQAAKAPVDVKSAAECAQLIESLAWETPELKDTLLDMAKKHDQQLIAFYRSLRGFPSSFTNVAAKYAKFSKKK